jgi:ech hydrogenase subunit B
VTGDVAAGAVALAAAATGTLLAPIAVVLAMGVDRRVTAAMQLRAGPPILQPLYDLTKLVAKATPATDRPAAALLVVHVLLAAGAFASALAGGDLLVAALLVGAAEVAFILAAGAVESPYAQVGASREVVLLVAFEPPLLLAVLALGASAGTFSAWDVAAASPPLAVAPTLLVTLAVVLAATLRKSPFDLASSGEAHQELVKGSTTEMAGRWLALAELGHWYEAAFVLLLIWLTAGRVPLLAGALTAGSWVLVVVADNALPRATWRVALAAAWGIGLLAAAAGLATARLAAGGTVP